MPKSFPLPSRSAHKSCSNDAGFHVLCGKLTYASSRSRPPCKRRPLNRCVNIASRPSVEVECIQVCIWHHNIYRYTYTYMCIYIYIYRRICVCVCRYIHIHACIHTYIHAYFLYIHAYAHIYIYTYMCVCKEHVCTYVRTTHNEPLKEPLIFGAVPKTRPAPASLQGQPRAGGRAQPGHRPATSGTRLTQALNKEEHPNRYMSPGQIRGLCRQYIYIYLSDIYIHTYACVYIYTHVCTGVYIYMWLCVYICKYIHKYVYMYICACICLCTYIYKHRFSSIYIHTYICMHIYICVQIFIHVYIYTCIRAYVCIYIYV